MTDLLHSNYIIDGVQMALSPERMLRECTVEPPAEQDGAPETLADETLDLRPDNFQFKESSVASYAKAIGEKRTFPLPFAASYTAGKVAQALVDAIWMAGHFRLGDLTLKAEWKWNCKQMGDAAAFYHSVESACDYLDALGVKMDKYSLSSGQPAVKSAHLAPAQGIGHPPPGKRRLAAVHSLRPLRLPAGRQCPGSGAGGTAQHRTGHLGRRLFH